jgi:two-component system response regulator FixJ
MNDDIVYHAYFNRERLVHIIDPDLKTCETLSVVFRLEGFRTTFSTDRSTFLTGLDRQRPDIVVTNVDLGSDSGIDLIAGVKAKAMGIAMFAIMDTADVEATVNAMKAGARDVFTKPVDSEPLIRAVRDALRHDLHIGVAGSGQPVEIVGFSRLTDRERQVLQLIVNGQSNKETGRELGISPRTVEVHRARVMEKLAAKNTADLIRIVMSS